MDVDVDAPGQLNPTMGTDEVSFVCSLRANNVAKRKFLASLLSFLLSSCISITKVSDVSTPHPDFVTVTLAPGATQWIPTVSVLPDTVTPSPAMTTSADCTNAAILLRDVTIPDQTQVKAGETFKKTWEFQNTGTCSWTNYTLRFVSGDEINAPSIAAMPAAAPQEKVQVSMELTAPTADGRYAGYFTLYSSNGDVIPIGAEKTFWVKFTVGDYAVVPLASGAAPVQSGNCIQWQNAKYANQVIILINAERANVGLPPLTVDPQITAFAQSHADDMAFNNFLSHDGSNASFGERMRQHSMLQPAHPIFGEILAIGTPQDAMEQWRRDGHWDYVLGNFAYVGAGYAYNSCSDYGGYITVDLG